MKGKDEDMDDRLYVIEIESETGLSTLKFNTFDSFAVALATITETVDGFEEGRTKVIASREKEKNPV